MDGTPPLQSMRLLAERVLGITGTFLEGEIGALAMKLRAPHLEHAPQMGPAKHARQATIRALDKVGGASVIKRALTRRSVSHLYCSAHNRGAAELVAEVNAALDIHVTMSSRPEQLGSCERMLVLLNSETFTSANGRRFVSEVEQAMSQGVHLLLAQYDAPLTARVRVRASDALRACTWYSYTAMHKGCCTPHLHNMRHALPNAHALP